MPEIIFLGQQDLGDVIGGIQVKLRTTQTPILQRGYVVVPDDGTKQPYCELIVRQEGRKYKVGTSTYRRSEDSGKYDLIPCTIGEFFPYEGHFLLSRDKENDMFDLLRQGYLKKLIDGETYLRGMELLDTTRENLLNRISKAYKTRHVFSGGLIGLLFGIGAWYLFNQDPIYIPVSTVVGGEVVGLGQLLHMNLKGKKEGIAVQWQINIMQETLELRLRALEL